MKTILVTGGAGFIAHHTVDYLLKNTDFNIVTLDRLDYSGNLNRLNDVVKRHDASERKRVRTVFHDLKAELNPQIISSIGNVDYIAHLAAGSHVDRSIDYPMEFVLDNVVGTVNIMEYARKCDNLQKFIFLLMKYLVQHLKMLNTGRTIDIIQQILTAHQKLEQKN
jgi:dTDP-glucose 4,6-dehydratase